MKRGSVAIDLIFLGEDDLDDPIYRDIQRNA